MNNQVLIHALPTLSTMFQQQLSLDLQTCLKYAKQAPDQSPNKITKQNNKSLITFLISVGGFANQDLPMSGCLAANPPLKECPALYSLLSAIKAPLARVCLIKTENHTEQEQSLLDLIYCNSSHHLFYQTHLLQCDKQYILRIETQRPTPLINTKDQAHIPQNNSDGSLWQAADLEKAYESLNKKVFTFDALNLVKPALAILSPEQLDAYLLPVRNICQTISNKADDNQTLLTEMAHFQQQWGMLYDKFSQSYTGEWAYQTAINHFREKLLPLLQQLINQVDQFDQCGQASKKPNEESQKAKNTIKTAIDTISQQLIFSPPAPRRIDRQVLLKARRRKKFKVDHLNLVDIPYYNQPLFIVSAPRAGSTLLFETLSKFPELWSTGEENHELIEDIVGLHPRDQQFHSNRLTETQANLATREAVLKAFSSRLQNRAQAYYFALEKDQQPKSIRFLEKTPKNALRIPFLKALFPDAKFIYLHRDYTANVSSLIDGWRSQRFIAYRHLPHLPHRHWNFLLIPNWQTLLHKSVTTIAKQQWEVSNHIIQQDLAQLSSNDWIKIDYQTLIKHPLQVVEAIAKFANLTTDEPLLAHCRNGLPISRLTLSTPNQDKWEKHRCFLMENRK